MVDQYIILCSSQATCHKFTNRLAQSIDLTNKEVAVTEVHFVNLKMKPKAPLLICGDFITATVMLGSDQLPILRLIDPSGGSVGDPWFVDTINTVVDQMGISLRSTKGVQLTSSDVKGDIVVTLCVREKTI